MQMGSPKPCPKAAVVTGSPSIVDLFSGAGGLAEGFRQAGYKVLAGADYDPDACATFAANFPEAATIPGDLRDAETHERVVAAASSATVVVGGPPCQAFSQVRNFSRIIDDPRNSLYREFVSIVDAVRPRALVMENVPGMEQMGVKEQVVEDLSLGGEYRVVPQLLNAVDFGVPQTRRRLVFVGVHRSMEAVPPLLVGSGASGALDLRRSAKRGKFRYELVTARGDHAASIWERLTDPHDTSVVSARQAISDLERLRVGRREDTLPSSSLPEAGSNYQKAMRDGSEDDLRNVQVPRMNEDTRLRLKGIPPGGNFRDLADELLDRYISGQKWGPHSGSGKLDRRHYYAYRRLFPDLWSWTLNTKADSVYHYSSSRALSVREFARIQSFPDRFLFTTDPAKGPLPGRLSGGPAHSRYRQVGNAVPPLLARHVAEALLPVLAGE
jgi:DNA (cytosine-5)-methyltransferase 1